MKRTFCYNSKNPSPVDVALSKEMNLPISSISNLRGLYDERHEDAPISEDLSKVSESANILLEFRKTLKNADNAPKEAHKTPASMLADAYVTLKHNGLTARQRVDRITLLSVRFQQVLNDLAKKYPEYTREQIIRGVTDNSGVKRFGTEALFNFVKQSIINDYSRAKQVGATKIVNALELVLDNWEAFELFTKVNLKNVEGYKFKLDSSQDYAEEANEDEIAGTVLAELFDLEESTKESWQEMSDSRSAFGLCSKEVRRFLSRIPLLDANGNIERDDIGVNRYLNPIYAHQVLVDSLRGITTEANMVAKLKTLAETIPWIRPIAEYFDIPSDSVIAKGSYTSEQLRNIKQWGDYNSRYALRTAFLCDLHKNFQKYGKLDKKRNSDGTYTYKTLQMNKTNEGKLVRTYLANFNTDSLVPSNSSIFTSDGKINFSNIRTLVDFLKDNFVTPKSDENKSIYAGKERAPWYKLRQRDKIETLRTALSSLGIDVTTSTLQNIVTGDRKRQNSIVKNLEKLTDTSKGGLKKLLEQEKANPNIKFSEAINLKGENVSSFIQAITPILREVVGANEALKVESRALWKNRKGKTVSLSSNVNPSYLGDFIEKLHAFVDTNDKAGLKAWLETRYLNCPYFAKKQDDGYLIYNTWLRQLYTAATSPGSLENSFADRIEYKRLVGMEGGIDFEDFTKSMHLVDLIQEFAFADNTPGYGNYPTFVLGDSGVTKYIKAPIYSISKIIDNLYNVYLQEIERQKLVAASNKLLDKGNPAKGVDSYSRIVNFRRTENEFTILTFLNEPKYRKFLKEVKTEVDGKTTTTFTEDSVKEAITEYFKDSLAKFKQTLKQQGLLDTVQVKRKNGKATEKYVHFNNLIGTGTGHYKTIDDLLETFYYNYRFATIQQIQMFTVDPAFYGIAETKKGIVGRIKDMQKRYKEIHASGTPLSLEARDFDGKLYSEDGKETSVYIDDISVSSRETFKGVVKSVGGNPDNYNSNTLTDGQGYRSLESYRKVMGMAGKWTPAMEEVYKLVLEARAFRKQGKTKEFQEKLKEIEAKNVVFQPIKPFLYTLEQVPLGNGQYLLVPVQHKYAEAVLIPELLPEGKLRDLADWMDENKVDVVASTKSVKVGSFGSVNIKDADSRASLNAALNNAYVHVLNYSDYRIQTNVPEHIYQARLFATQIRKLILSGLQFDAAHNNYYAKYFEGFDDFNGTVNLGRKNAEGEPVVTPLTPRGLISFYNALIISQIRHSMRTFSKAVENPQGLSDSLLQSAANNGRDSADHLKAYALKDNKKFTIPLFEGGLVHDSFSLLSSLFRKKVNKQTINGGSAVQVSPFGVEGYKLYSEKEEDRDLQFVFDVDENGNQLNNILYGQAEVPFDLRWTDNKGLEHELNYDDWVESDGHLKLSNTVLTPSDKRYKQYQSYRDKDGKVRIPLIEQSFPGILSIVAYRIPTERDYSMLNLQIVRFSRKTSGGTIRVPEEGTTIAGFDFDIDKLYFMRREFKQASKFTEETIARIWEDLWKANPEVRDRLRSAREKFSSYDETADKKLLSALFNVEESELSDSIVKKLHEYWEEAGLEGTYTEFFNKFLAANINKYLDWESYNFNLSPDENSYAAKNNMLLRIISQRLMDPETMKARTTPGGFKQASNSARYLRELLFGTVKGLVNQKAGNISINWKALQDRAKDVATDPEPDYDFDDPMTLVLYNEQNQVAGKLIGIFANQNTNHVFASLMRQFQLQRPIAFAGKAFTDFLHAPEGVDVDNNMAELLAASVDAVKDPVLNYLNLNIITADMGATLIRLGYTTFDVGLLFNQPIIKEVCDYAANNGVQASAAIDAIRAKYINGTAKGANIPIVNATKDLLAYNIVQDRMAREADTSVMQNRDYAVTQLGILDLFEDIYATTSEVTSFVQNTRFTAANSVGSTPGDFYAQQLKVAKYIKSLANQKDRKIILKVNDVITSPILDMGDMDITDEEYLASLSDDPFGYEQAMYDANVRFINKTINKYYPFNTRAYVSVRNLLANLSSSETLTADEINDIHDDILSYMLETPENSMFNPNFILTRADGSKKITAKEYYTTVFAEGLKREIQSDPNLSDYPIIANLIFTAESSKDTAGNETSTIQMQLNEVGGMDVSFKDTLTDSWEDLYENEKYRDIAIGLFLYNYYKKGFAFSPVTFIHLAPTAVKQGLMVGDTSYVDFLDRIIDGNIPVNPGLVAFKYISTHLTDWHFTFEAKTKEQRGVLSALIPRTGALSNTLAKSFTVSEEAVERITNGRFKDFCTHSSNGSYYFKPVIIYNGSVYVANNLGVSESGEIEYTYYGRVDQNNPDVVIPSASSGLIVDGKISSSTEETQDTLQDETKEPISPNTPSSEVGDNTIPSLDNASISYIKEIARLFIESQVKQGNLMPEEIENRTKELEDQILGIKTEDFKESVDYLLQQIAKTDVYSVDENGKITKMCK